MEMLPRQELLYDQKWHRLAPRARIFEQIPFVDFVFGSGSLAVGNVDEQSDFDVLIGVRQGRIFTVRFLSALFLGLRGWRRSKEHGGESAADKVCLNHFVTQQTYQLRLPINAYWKLLYTRLVPLYGSAASMQVFFDANEAWLGQQRVEINDLRYQGSAHSRLRRFLQRALQGKVGDFFEALVRRYQVARIEKGLRTKVQRTPRLITILGEGEAEKIALPPLIVYNDNELEFHPDPAIVEIGGRGSL